MTSFEELFFESMNALDMRKMEAGISKLSKKQFQQAFDEAFSFILEEKALAELATSQGVPIADKDPEELSLIGLAFLLVAEGHERGLEFKDSAVVEASKMVH